MKPALAQVCSLDSPFDRDIADYAAGKCPAIELWTGKLDAYLDRHSVDDFKRLVAEHHVETPVLSFQGGLLASQGEFRKQHWESFERRLALCRELNIGTLVVAADVAGQLSQQDIERVQASLPQAADRAATHQVRLALEFQARALFVNNLQTAVALVAEAGHPNLGVCLDAFHFYVGPSKTEDLGYLTSENLFHVQLCDLAGVARELAADADRILPGEGDLPIESIVERLRQIDYQGHVAIELLNPHIWRVGAVQFGEIGMTALRRVLGLASME